MSHKPTVWYKRAWKAVRLQVRWLTPGIGVKRWIGLILAGITLLAVGFAILILDFYRTAPDAWWLPIISFLSLRFLDRTLRSIVFGGLGIGLIVWGMWGFNRALYLPFMHPGKPFLETVTAYHRKDKGPRVVVIGGGTGLSSVLRGLKVHTNNLTAIVTVADDGGSSGELRKSIGILPPGDIRNCLTALSSDEALLTKIFQYRFAADVGLNGHTLGNLFITALTDITGSFEEAVAESGRVLAVQGRVLPSTLHDVRLVADVQLGGTKGNSVQIKGESKITKAGGKITRLWLEPDNSLAYPPAIQAILSADLILIGPGSLYTSILPNLLVDDITQAIQSSRALKFYICNVATQPGETDHYSSSDHLRVLEKQVEKGFFDLVICNNNCSGVLEEDHQWVVCDQALEEDYAVYSTDLVDKNNVHRHDSTRLAQVIMDLYFERTGPLV